VAKLAKKSERIESGLFLLEGPQAVREALVYRPDVIVDIYATQAALDRHPDLAQLAEDLRHRIDLASESVIAAMSDTVTPQGIIAVAKVFPVALSQVLAGQTKLIAIVHEIRDPGNAGTIIRAADSAGADAVIFSGESIDPYHPKVVRATTGSLFHIPVAIAPQLATLVPLVKGSGLTILAADVRGDDLTVARDDGTLAKPAAWLFGNEARGLSDESRAIADRSLRVPIYGAAESMNLATAASVCLYQSAFEQRRS
jgi:TrmH family RNA methyltransferase